MPNTLDATGLTTKTQAELITDFTTFLQTIYGADINLDQDTPDGQWMMIMIQAILDQEDLLTQVYNFFDPDNAIGVVLDQRVAINGIQRQGGTFTVTPVTLTIAQALTLYGLDQSVQPVYTVQDNAGNQWQLQQTTIIPGAGTYIENFQAAQPGAILTVPNTITLPVTIVLGVSTINNPSTYTILGVNEESDAALKIRRQKSVSIGSQGYLAGLYAALANVPGMATFFIYENNTDTTDGSGTPSHTIWVITSGSATDADIAEAIYTKRNAGAGMRGATTFVITQVDGTPFTVRWDVVADIPLYISFNVHSIDGIHAPNVTAIINYLVLNFVPGVFQEVNINELATLTQLADPNALALFTTGVNGFSSVSNTGPWFNVLQPTSQQDQFIVSSPNITLTIV